MKKTLTFLGLIVFITLMFASCSKDKNEETVVNISGTTWGLTYLKIGTATDMMEYTTKAELEDIGEYEEFEFTSDGKIYITGGKGNSNHELYGNWKQADNKVSITQTDNYKYDLTLSSNTLIYSKTYTGGYIEEYRYTKQ